MQLGLYPLVTMAAMFAGLRMMGFGGMLLAPIMVLILKAALAEPGDVAVAKQRAGHKFGKRQKNPPAAGA
ncbi:hypothetical protein SDC9_179901 [bioreactor metagenome]|uniref:Uncharacterized protein n=1 Tax=bioreactor metagenome TaxID=1076179 RepID=A0A645H9F7_9ZZZZ